MAFPMNTVLLAGGFDLDNHQFTELEIQLPVSL